MFNLTSHTSTVPISPYLSSLALDIVNMQIFILAILIRISYKCILIRISYKDILKVVSLHFLLNLYFPSG